MKCEATEIPDVLLITPGVFPDARGFFMETFSGRRYAEAGMPVPFVQDNHSNSCKGVLRGLHYQIRRPQGKLVYAVTGEILDVAVDIRRGSPTFGRSVTCVLSATNHAQLYIPPGFAHGFCVLSESADVMYKCTDYYEPGDDCGVIWNDPQLAIPWPGNGFLISPKDLTLPRLAEIPPEKMPVYKT